MNFQDTLTCNDIRSCSVNTSGINNGFLVTAHVMTRPGALCLSFLNRDTVHLSCKRRTTDVKRIRHVLGFPGWNRRRNYEKQKDAPMTKNNLTTHLKWLLKQGPSLYPSLTLSAHENRNNANNQNPPHVRPILEQPTVDIELGKEGHPDSIAGTFVKGTGADDADVKVDDTNMARLLLAPQSANKPRLLSSPKEPVEGNKAGNSGAHEKSPSEQRKRRNPNVVKGMAAYSCPRRNCRRLTMIMAKIPSAICLRHRTASKSQPQPPEGPNTRLMSIRQWSMLTLLT